MRNQEQPPAVVDAYANKTLAGGRRLSVAPMMDWTEEVLFS